MEFGIIKIIHFTVKEEQRVKRFFGRIWEFSWNLVFWLPRIATIKRKNKDKIIVSAICVIISISGTMFIVELMELLTQQSLNSWCSKIEFGMSTYLVIGIIINGIVKEVKGNDAGFL